MNPALWGFGFVPVPTVTFTIFITSSTRLPAHRPRTSPTRAGTGECDRLRRRMPRGGRACRRRHGSSPTRSGWGRRVRSATEASSRPRGRREGPEEMGLSSPLHARSGRVRCRSRRAVSVSRETRGQRMCARRRDEPRAPAASRGESPVCGASPRESRERDGICQPGRGPPPTLRVPYGPISVTPEALRSSARTAAVRSGRQISA